jgi:hypothetical protein
LGTLIQRREEDPLGQDAATVTTCDTRSRGHLLRGATITETGTLTKEKKKKRKDKKDRRRRLDFIRRKSEEKRVVQADTRTTTQGLSGADAATAAGPPVAATRSYSTPKPKEEDEVGL